MSVIKDYILGNKKKVLSDDIYMKIQKDKIEKLEYKIISKNTGMTKERLDEILSGYIDKENQCNDSECKKYKYECRIRMHQAKIKALQFKNSRIIFQTNKDKADIKRLQLKTTVEENKRKIYYLTQILGE